MPGCERCGLKRSSGLRFEALPLISSRPLGNPLTRSRCPRTFARRTQNPFSALWKVTRSTRPASTSWVDDTGCGFIRIDASSIFAAALKVGGRLTDAEANLAKLILCYAFARYLLPQGVRLR